MAESSRRPLELPYHGLRTKPFRENTDPAFLWLGPSYREALNTLRAGVQRDAGVLLLTGEVGVGKTMLARALADRLAAEGVRVARLGPVALQPEDFRNGVARALGVAAGTDAREGLREVLRAARARGEKVLLIVDEAQNLDATLLDEVADLVRLGRDVGDGAVDVLNVLLVAQPSIEPLLRRRKRHDRADFVSVRARLRPLDVAEVGEYVLSRLRAAGADRELFSMDALAEVAAMSGGVPRLINQVCDRTLLVTSPWNGCMVSAGVVRGAFRDVDPALAIASRRWIARSGLRPALYAAAVVLVVGLGVFAYLEGFVPALAPAPARDTATTATPPVAAPAPDTEVTATPSPAAAAPTTPGVPATAATSEATVGTESPSARDRAAVPRPTATAAERTPAEPVAPPPAPRTTPPERRVPEARAADATERPLAPRTTPVAPARVRVPAPAVSAPPSPRPPARESAPEPPPSRPAPGAESPDDPAAIIDWLLQRNPAAGR